MQPGSTDVRRTAQKKRLHNGTCDLPRPTIAQSAEPATRSVPRRLPSLKFGLELRPLTISQENDPYLIHPIESGVGKRWVATEKENMAAVAMDSWRVMNREAVNSGDGH